MKAHIDARQFVVLISLVFLLFIPFSSSNESRYPCPDCGKGFTDPAARIRHRKTAHGYQPYHTPRYLAKRVFKAAEMKRAKAGLNKTRAQQAANVVPRSAQNASSSTDTLSNLVANATYHNDFWKLLVDVPRRDASELNVSQRVQIHAPIAVAPARDTPETLHSGSDLSLPMVGQQASTTQQRDGTYWLDPQFGTTMQPQSQALDQLWTAYGHQIPGVASDYHPFAATFPAPVTALNWSPF